MRIQRTPRQELLSEIIAEGLDRLATLDLHGRGIVEPIYRLARHGSGGKPLSYTFAKALIERSVEGTPAIVATGFMIRKAMQPETDGLTGAAYLSRVLSRGLGVMPVLICEEEAADAARAAMDAAGLRQSACNWDSLANKEAGKGEYLTITYPMSGKVDGGNACGAVNRNLTSLDPCLFLSIERPGRNDKGVPHTTFGLSVADLSSDIDFVFMGMKERKIPTFAVGDMGNELGMGAVSKLVAQITPYGGTCRCGCGGGVAAAGTSDFTMMGSVSDDACYSVGASIAEQLGMDELLPDEGMIKATLEAAVTAGAVDGLTAESELSIDMVRWSTHAQLIGLMRECVLGAREHDCTRPQFIDHLLKLKSFE